LTGFAIGLAKKVLLADPLAADVAVTFEHPSELGVISGWYAVVGYSLQLYFDFSGYSDMAIGLARMFNIRFPLNFNSPYKATTVIDYWQRFHMTLTRFITMYIFSPMALAVTRWRARHGLDNSRRASATPGGFLSVVAGPTLITMGLAGIWHGAGTQYLIFGLLHGFYITVNHACRIFFPSPKKRAPRPFLVETAVHVSKVLGVYVAALVAFAFFRAASTSDALQVLAGMAGLHGVGPGVPLWTLPHLAVLSGIIWLAPNTQQLLQVSFRRSARWAIAVSVLLAAGLVSLPQPTSFLYFNF
jgi:D-alanyl-lipoteichoic acid acyltransferase DltB (MBOAT superfamily)